ncbi:MAG: hypothetical protein K2G53_07130 [Muribaculaceae bacterium]|nr:hypothetical protein [Muribaculaceae bacterium]
MKNLFFRTSRLINSVLCGTITAAISFGALTASGGEQKNLEDIRMDSTIKDHKIIFFGKGDDPSKDSTTALIQKFYEDQFRHFQDPLAPYFLFMSKDSQLAMGIGGCVRMRGYFDWGGAIPSSGFAPYLIPMQKDPLNMRAFGTTPAGTALFFRVIGINKHLGNYQLYIECNFNGYKGRDFHLKKAYAMINDWTIGYANSTFSDPAATPPEVDAAGSNSKMSATAVLVRWTHELPKGFTIAASAETPSDQIEVVPEVTGKVTQYIPDIAAFAQYSWQKSNHVRLAAIARSLPYRNLIADKNHYMTGYGLQLSTVFHPFHAMTLYGCINGGQGYSSMGGDWLMGAYDLVANPNKPGELYSPFCYGGYGAVQYNFTPMIFASATVGGTRYAPKYAVAGDQYKQGLYMAANVFWYLTPRISCALEFDLGSRLNFDGQRAWARRLGAFVSFSF